MEEGEGQDVEKEERAPNMTISPNKVAQKKIEEAKSASFLEARHYASSKITLALKSRAPGKQKGQQREKPGKPT